MITIYAEKPDVGNKIAAALDEITLNDGTKVTYKNLKKFEKKVKAQQFKDGFLKISFMGEECYVTWGYGHLCELKQAVDYDASYKNWKNIPLPFIPETYETKVKDGVKKQFLLVKDLMKRSSLVINATDYDREGELIFHYLYKEAKCRTPFKRACFSSQTETAFKDSFAHLKDPDEVENMTNAGIGRSIADAIVGWNITTKLTLQTQSKTPLSVGRVQTPTLNFLVKREKEILAFKPEPYYTISAEFETEKKEKYKGEHKTKKFKDKTEAEKILKEITGHPGIVKDIKKELQKKEAPNLYSLSTLQMAASKRYGFSLKKTLEIAQELYEGGFTTYPRTDSQFLTEDMEPTVNKVLDMLEKIPEYSGLITGKTRSFKKKKYFDDTKVGSHFAIIPTTSIPSSLTADQQKIYDLIARSVIMMLYSEAEYEKTTVITDVVGNDFISSGNVILTLGWLEVDNVMKETKLPKLTLEEVVSGTYKMESKMTQPPKRYTDSTLLSAMVSAGKELDDEELKNLMMHGVHGIGTEATRAAIVETLIKRGYAERDKKTIYATAKGIALIDILPIEAIKSAELTAVWENRLNKIAEGKEDLKTFVKDIEQLTRDWVDELNEKIKSGSIIESSNRICQCPKCKKGYIIKTRFGYGCSEYKNGCKFTVSGEISGKKITEANIKDIASKGKTGVLTFKKKVGGTYKGKLVINDEYKIQIEYANNFAAKTPKKT